MNSNIKGPVRDELVVSFCLGHFFVRATNEKYRKKVWYGNEKRQQGMGEGGQVKVMPFSDSILCVRTCLSTPHATTQRERQVTPPPALKNSHEWSGYDMKVSTLLILLLLLQLTG